jgi:hypothetical protein
MKITREKKEFAPVTITLETEKELQFFYALFCYLNRYRYVSISAMENFDLNYKPDNIHEYVHKLYDQLQKMWRDQ